MEITVSKSELHKLRLRMKRAFPKERIEAIWGIILPDGNIEIHMFDPIKHTATKFACYMDEDDTEISMNEAEHNGYKFLGTVHSHTNMGHDASPSEFDWEEGARSGEIISGILSIWKDKKDRLRTKIKFWEAVSLIYLKLVD